MVYYRCLSSSARSSWLSLTAASSLSTRTHSLIPSRARDLLGSTAWPSLTKPSSTPYIPDAFRPAPCAGLPRPRLAPGNQDIVGQKASHRAFTSCVPRLGDQMSPPASGINTRPAPPVRAYTPPPPDPDSSTFLTDQVAKQQRSNFHSTSLRTVSTMVAQTVNRTALHPKGVEYVWPSSKRTNACESWSQENLKC